MPHPTLHLTCLLLLLLAIRVRPRSGLSALVCQAWELKDDLTALPSAGRTPMATQQRAAGLGLCLALAAGWRDLGAYKRIYARWAWMRKSSVDEALVGAGGQDPSPK